MKRLMFRSACDRLDEEERISFPRGSQNDLNTR